MTKQMNKILKPLKISFDIGGVITKFPEEFKTLIHILNQSDLVEIYVITDIPEKVTVLEILKKQGLDRLFDYVNIISADYSKYGESCKAKVMKELGINIHIDDHMPYLVEGCTIGLFVVPRIDIPYCKKVS